MLHTLNVDVKVIICNHPTCSIIDYNTLVTHNYVNVLITFKQHIHALTSHIREIWARESPRYRQRMVFIA